MPKRCILFGLVVIAAAIGLWLYPTLRLRTAFAEERLRAFEELFKEHVGSFAPSEAVPPRSGKVLVMVPGTCHTGRNILPRTIVQPEYWGRYKEIDPPRMHDAMYALSSSVRASEPEEVGTLILCQPFSEQIVEKSDTWEDEYAIYWIEYYRGRRRCLLLTFLDVATGRLLGSYVLPGPPPEGGRPDELGALPDVAEFVQSLPST